MHMYRIASSSHKFRFRIASTQVTPFGNNVCSMPFETSIPRARASSEPKAGRIDDALFSFSMLVPTYTATPNGASSFNMPLNAERLLCIWDRSLLRNCKYTRNCIIHQPSSFIDNIKNDSSCSHLPSAEFLAASRAFGGHPDGPWICSHVVSERCLTS